MRLRVRESTGWWTADNKNLSSTRTPWFFHMATHTVSLFEERLISEAATAEESDDKLGSGTDSDPAGEFGDLVVDVAPLGHQ